MQLEGDFDESYYTGDNAKIVPTDTQKNTVYILAKDHPCDPIEDFALLLGRHFLNTYSHVSAAQIFIEENQWTRVFAYGKPHAHTFQATHPFRRFCRLRVTRDGKVDLKSGVAGLTLCKSTKSGFEGYPVCKYTSLVETKDRMMRSEVFSEWTYDAAFASRAFKQASGYNKNRFNQAFSSVCEHLIAQFSGLPAEEGDYSASVQKTMYDMGKAALGAVSELSNIYISCPNLHCILFDMTKFGLKNDNQVFMSTTEPHGLIECLITRNNVAVGDSYVPPSRL